jgi:hypothetical protein
MENEWKEERQEKKKSYRLISELFQTPVVAGPVFALRATPTYALTLYFKLRLGYKNFYFARPSLLLLLLLVITFFASPLSFSLLHDSKRTNER